MKKLLLPLFALALLSGCATRHQDHYYWGSYEQLLLDMYVNPGSATPDMQIEKLTADIQKAEALGKPTPPGVFAHLGLMYATQGNSAQAEAAFAKEEQLYPESKTLIDGMLKRSHEKK